MLDSIFENLNNFWLRLQLTWRLLKDERVPLWTKAIPVLTFLYLFSPLDVLPDFLVVLGQLDDVVILVGGMELFERLVPEEIVAEHKQRLQTERETQA